MDLETLIKTIVAAVTGSTALYGAIMGYRNHKRLRTFDPENHLFKIKVEAYQAILDELGKLLDKLDDARILFKKAINKEIEKTEEEWESFSTEIDNEIESFRIKIAKFQFLTPKWISDEIDRFYTIVADDSDIISENMLDALEDISDRAYAISNSIAKRMQEDLNLPELHTNLYKRTKVEKRKFWTLRLTKS